MRYLALPAILSMAVLTACTAPQQAAAVQGLNDLAMCGMAVTMVVNALPPGTTDAQKGLAAAQAAAANPSCAALPAATVAAVTKPAPITTAPPVVAVPTP